MNYLRLLPLACLVASPLCAQPSSRSLPPRTAILTGKAALVIFKPCSRGEVQGVQGYWKPAGADIARLETALPAYLATQKLPRSARTRGITGDLHQCAGFVRDGRRWVYVNAFSRRHAEETRRALATIPPRKNQPWDWRREGVDVCDGGTDFWSVEYEVRTGTFHNLQFNGPYEVER